MRGKMDRTRNAHGETALDEVPQVVVVRQGRKQLVFEVRHLPSRPYDRRDEGERHQRRDGGRLLRVRLMDLLQQTIRNMQAHNENLSLPWGSVERTSEGQRWERE